MSSRVDQLVAQMGAQEAHLMGDGRQLFKLEASTLAEALTKMGPTAVLWGNTKGDMKDALWTVAEPLVKTMMLAPDGKTPIEVK